MVLFDLDKLTEPSWRAQGLTECCLFAKQQRSGPRGLSGWPFSSGLTTLRIVNVVHHAVAWMWARSERGQLWDMLVDLL